MTPRIVLDTSVLVAATRSKRGASNALLRMLGTGVFETFVSTALALEYESVLLRELEATQYSREDLIVLVDSTIRFATTQEIHFRWRPFLRDEADEHIADLAIAAQASHIVTFNVRNFQAARKIGIAVVRPGAFLRTINISTNQEDSK